MISNTAKKVFINKEKTITSAGIIMILSERLPGDR
jgi:hypothetical protein